MTAAAALPFSFLLDNLRIIVSPDGVSGSRGVDGRLLETTEISVGQIAMYPALAG